MTHPIGDYASRNIGGADAYQEKSEHFYDFLKSEAGKSARAVQESGAKVA